MKLTLQDAIVLGKFLHASGEYKSKNEAGLICDCIEAVKNDWDPFFVVRESQVVMGKRQWSAFGMAAIAKRHGYTFKQKITPTYATVTVLKDGVELDTATFTAEQAAKAGLDSKDLYRKFGEDLYFARSMSRICRRNCQEAFNGSVYALGEIEEVETDNEPRPALSSPHAQAALPAPAAVVATVPDETVRFYAQKTHLEIRKFADDYGDALTDEQKSFLRAAFVEKREKAKAEKEAKAKLKEQLEEVNGTASEGAVAPEVQATA